MIFTTTKSKKTFVDNADQNVYILDQSAGAGMVVKGALNGDAIVLPGNVEDFLFKAGKGGLYAKSIGADGKALVATRFAIAENGSVNLVFSNGAIEVTRTADGIMLNGVKLGTSSYAAKGSVVQADDLNTEVTYAAVVAGEVEPTGDLGEVEVPGEAQTFSLTADIDELTGEAGDDVFAAGLTVAGAQTLNGFDTLNGGEGTDTLNATLINAGAVAPTLNSIEVLNLRSINATAGVDLVNATGVEQVWSDRSQNNLAVSNVENLVTIGAKGISENANHDYTVTYAANAVAETATQAIVLENADLNLDVNQGGAGLEVRNVTIASNGTANVVDFGTDLVDGTVIRNLTISGAADLEIDSSDAITATVVDASAATGDLNLTVDVGNVVAGLTRSITLGSGDDELDASALGNNLDAMNGGAGYDTLIVANAATTDALVANVRGFEAIQINGLAGAARSYATLANLGFQEVILSAANGGQLSNLTASSKVTLVDQANNLTLTMASATGNSDSFAFTVEGQENADSIYAVTIDDVESLTITTVDQDADNFNETTLTLSADALQNLTVKGSEAVVFDGTTGNTDALERVDVSGVTVTTTGTDLAADITVGDNVTVIGTASNDSITFGDQSVVTGGAGNDTFVVASNSTENLFGTITDFAAGDVIDFVADVTAIDEIVVADLGLAPAVNATFADFVDAATAVAVADGVVSHFVFDGNTYLVFNDTANAGFNAGEDQLVKLTGTVDLSDLEIGTGANAGNLILA